MTNSGKSNQGEGSVVRGLHVATPTPARWTQRLLVPMECVRVELVVHQSPGEKVWCLGIEVTDPHSKELLAKVVEPSRHYSAVRTIPVEVAIELRHLLEAALDPDPF